MLKFKNFFIIYPKITHYELVVTNYELRIIWVCYNKNERQDCLVFP